MHVLPNKLGALSVLLSDAMAGALGGLSPTAAALLLTLYYRPGLTGTELAQVAGIAQPTASRVLDGLVHHGWVQRRARTGRTMLLRLTPLGRRQAQSLQAARLRAMDGLVDGLPARDRAAFEQLVDTVLASTTTSRAQARTTCRLCDHAVCDGPLCPIGTRATELEQTNP
jgi:DNA-binding MarR family transcriptional regulator